MTSKRSAKVRTAILISLVVVFVLLMIILGLALFIGSKRDNLCRAKLNSRTLDPVSTFLTSLNMTDGLDVGWYHGNGSRNELKEALKGNFYHMFITTVSIRQESGSDVAYSGSSAEDLLHLSDWLDTVLSFSGKGALIELQTNDQVEQVLKLLQSRTGLNSQPIWLKLKVSSTNGESNTPVDFETFTEKVTALSPDALVHVAVEWVSSGCCEEGYNRTIVRQMWTRLQHLGRPINIVVSAEVVDTSWPNLKWLLGKSSNTTMTITKTANSESCPSFELLSVRNDFVKTRIFFDLGQSSCLSEFKKLSRTAGSALHHFSVDWDASRVTWGHAVNSRQKLKDALEDGVMFLEADILLRGQGTDAQTDIPVMAHPPAIDSDITFSQWLDKVAKTDRGIKLDFKSIESVIPSLRILNTKRDQLHQPVWLNSDVLLGPNTNKTPVNATAFLQAVNEYFPDATLSLGWTTGWTNTADDVGYSEEMVRAMDDLCRALPQPVTFPIRAAAAKKSWCHLQWLLEQSHRYTITIWTGSKDVLQQEDMNYVRRHSERSKVYFDLPAHLMPDV